MKRTLEQLISGAEYRAKCRQGVVIGVSTLKEGADYHDDYPYRNLTISYLDIDSFAMRRNFIKFYRMHKIDS